MTTTRLIAAIISLVAIVALMAIVSLAIGTNRLGDLVFGAFVLGAIMIGLAWVGVNLYSRMSASRAERERLRYEFIQNMAAKGALPNDGSFMPLHALQLSAPQVQPKQAGTQIIFNPNALRESAVNLLLFSMRQCGPDQNRIASGPECAAAGVNGYTPRTWGKIVNDYLKPRYDVVTVRGGIDNGGGTFVPDTYGTVKTLYDKVMLDGAVDALPGRER
jgi:hypothetical protein